MNQTPIQRASALVLGAYQAAGRLLDAEERAVLRNIIAAAIVRDAAAMLRDLDDLEDRAA